MQPWTETAIYKKAKEIKNIVDLLIEHVKDSELPNADEVDLDIIQERFVIMSTNSSDIIDYLAGASEPNRPYDYCMENAVFIKKAAQELQGDAIYIEDMGLKDIDYLDLLHDEIEAFRLLFIEWVKTFELWKYEGEDWGLFNHENIRVIDVPPDEDDLFDDEDDEDDEEDEDD